MKKESFFNKIVFLINSILATLLLLSFLLPYISPKSIPILAIFSLLVPILIFINLFFGLYWLLKLKKQVFLSMFIVSICWFFTPPIYKFFENKSEQNLGIKIMSYNVRMFNHWKWIDEKAVPEKIYGFIMDKSPDILLFQEYYSLKEYYFKFPYKFIKTKSEKDRTGLAIFSNFPIINQGSFNFKETSNNVIYVDILKEKDTIRVYNLHLQSLQLKTDKENFGQENSEKLIENLKKGFKKQAEQTESLKNHEKNWKGKKIVAGDFNNTSYSWVYKQIIENKKDAFIEAGKGFGKTFNYWFPMRIDFILTDEHATIHQFTSFSENYSDHYPILARINW